MQNEAEDVYQKALMALWRHRREEILNPDGYLLMCVRNHALVASRDETARQRRCSIVSLEAIPDAAELFGQQATQEFIFAHNDALSIIAELPDCQREAMLCELGITTGKAVNKVTQCRARKNARRIAKQRETVSKIRAMVASATA
jgi:DNA-directed RNA polymerase specialized sigma24 family protein